MDNFWRLLCDRAREPGVVMAVSLATYEDIGSTLGIPCVEDAATRLRRAVIRAATPGATVGWLGWVDYGAFLPGADPTAAESFAQDLRRAVDEEAEKEFLPGEWAELRLAIGIAPVAGDDWDRLAALRRAVDAAKKDWHSLPEHRIYAYDENENLLAW